MGECVRSPPASAERGESARRGGASEASGFGAKCALRLKNADFAPQGEVRRGNPPPGSRAERGG